MELKTKYQYTYFIHPYIVKENKYKKYIAKLLKDKNCNLRVFQKERDLELYNYFSPKIRTQLFSTFEFGKNKINKMMELPMDTRVALISERPCVIFEYNFPKDIHGKTESNTKGIFFKIQRMELICFNTGICFLCIKTNLEDSTEFGDVLNFNYKFRDINQEDESLKAYEKIRVQSDSFSDIKSFRDFICDLTGTNIEASKLDINTERFLTYSYACIDQAHWNEDTNFKIVESEYIKFTNVLSNDSTIKYYDDIKSISKWKYAKMGISKNAITFFSSNIDMNNFTILPLEFENQYFYTYIFALYKKFYLNKLNYEFKFEINIKSVRKKFIEFTKNIWIQEITSNNIGTVVNENINEILELDKIYFEVKNKYDLFYKELNIEKNAKSSVLIVIILLILLFVNLLNVGLIK